MKIADASRRTTPSQANGRSPPAWDIALLFPPQGEWTEEEYLDLESNSQNRLIELDDGCLEVLPMPDLFHQGIVRFLFKAADKHVADLDMGEVFFAPLPIRLWAKQFREPDVLFLKKHRLKNRHKPPQGADLVMEVISKGKKNRHRDLSSKRRIYAKAKIPEYWLVDPEEETITVLWLTGTHYKIHGRFRPGDQAASRLLPGFEVNVSDLFAAGHGE